MRSAGFVLLVMMSTQASAQPTPPKGGLADPWAEDPPPPPPPAEPSTPSPADATTPAPVEDAQPLPPDQPDPTSPKPLDAATPDVIDPRELPVDEPFTPSPYPRSFVERPLVLPRGLRAFSIVGRIGRETIEEYRLRYGGGSVAVVHGYDGFSVDLGTDFILYDEHNLPEESVDIPKLQRLYAGVTWRLPSDSYVDVTGELGDFLTRYRRYSPSLTIGHKFRTSERGAIYVNGGVSYTYGNEDSYGFRYVSHRVAAYAGGTARIQAAPLLAVQVSGSIAQFKYVDDQPRTEDSYRSLSAGAAVLISISETADVSAFVGISSFGNLDVTSGGLSLTMRSTPE